MTFVPDELRAFINLLPQIVATCNQFQVTQKTYFEGDYYRVFYSEAEKAFINIDMMEKFEAKEIQHDDCRGVSMLIKRG